MNLLLLALIHSLPAFPVTVKGAESTRPSFEEIIFKTRPELQKQLKKKELSLDISEAEHGHISVQGPLEGRDEYFLFRGQPSDLVFHDQQGESLELVQNFDFYLITGTRIEKIKRSAVFPERAIKKAFERGREKIIALAKDHPWEDYVESFDLPIYDRDVRLVISNDDPSFYDNTKGAKADVATMTWTGKNFHLRETNKVSITGMKK